jgi:hypothetical protein
MVRHAIVQSTETDVIARMLPANFALVFLGDDCVHILGIDRAGWTLDDYVIPRLASALIFCEEVKE